MNDYPIDEPTCDDCGNCDCTCADDSAIDCYLEALDVQADIDVEAAEYEYECRVYDSPE